MDSRGLVWVTRAQPGASQTAARVQALGRTPLIAPLLEVRPVPAQVDLAGVAALAFTSANAVRAFGALTGDRTLPAYAVGASTAAALADVGFRIEGQGEGGVEALARIIARTDRRPAGRILHPAAREPAGDLVGLLHAIGLKAERLAVYDTLPSPSLAPSVEAALLDGEIETALIHSPKAARVLVRLSPPAALAGLRALGLSPACLAPFAGLTLAGRHASERPSDSALLALL